MTIEVAVKDMTCQGCESVVETAIEMLDGVESVDADRYEERVRVEGSVDPADVVDKIELAGYTPAPTSTSQPADDGASAGEVDESEDTPADDEPIAGEVDHDVIDEPASDDGQHDDA